MASTSYIRRRRGLKGPKVLSDGKINQKEDIYKVFAQADKRRKKNTTKKGKL